MPALQRASRGYLRRHPWQLALALVGICIGVAVMVAVDLANASAQRAFRLSVEAVNGRATHQLVGGPDGVDEELYRTLRVAAGVAGIAPVVSGSAALQQQTLTVLGVDPFAERDLRNYTAAGGATPTRSLLTTPGAVLLSAAQAAQCGIEQGDSFTLRINGVERTAVLAGTLDNGNQALDQLLVTDIATAQEWLGMQGRLSRIDAVLPDEAAADALRQHLPDGTELLLTARRSRAVSEMSRAFTTNLTAMSLLALLIGIFLIYNSVSFAVLQRRNLLGTLRALGVTRAEVFRLILREALLLGVVGAALGVVAGLWLGQYLLGLVSQSINDLYFRVSVTGIAVDPWSIGKGFAAGLTGTLAAAAVPAAEAASCPPRLAMTRSLLESRSGALLPWLAAAGGALVAAGSLLLAVSSHGLVTGLAAMFLLILGTALWIPPLVLAAIRVLLPALKRAAGTTTALAVAGIGASLSRTGVAIVALAVAVSATVGVTVMVDSFRGAVAAWLEQSLQSDFYVAVADGAPLDPTLLSDLLAVPGVARHSSRRRVWLEDPSGLTRLIALELPAGQAAGGELLDAAPAEIWPRFAARPAVLISESLAFRRGLARGDLLLLPTGRGERAFPVAATYRSYDSNAGAVLMSRRIYDTFWDDRAVDSLGLYLGDDADAGAVRRALRHTAAGRQALEIRSNRELREHSLAIFDRTFVITDVLYWLAVGVAVIGILGALLALQMERARELAVLRALGMTPRQLGAMVTGQAAVIGVLAGVAALPLGLLMAWVLIDVINRRAFGWSMQMQVEPGVLWIALALSAGSALLAGLYPAVRAARRRPALAMRED